MRNICARDFYDESMRAGREINVALRCIDILFTRRPAALICLLQSVIGYFVAVDYVFEFAVYGIAVSTISGNSSIRFTYTWRGSYNYTVYLRFYNTCNC